MRIPSPIPAIADTSPNRTTWEGRPIGLYRNAPDSRKLSGAYDLGVCSHGLNERDCQGSASYSIENRPGLRRGG